jgi:acetylornithine/succinyldiaminopimelate/putrescine aminotransferase
MAAPAASTPSSTTAWCRTLRRWPKSLGGGKAAIGAMIATRDVYMKAYGTPKTAMIHAAATFGGIGEASITSIEALNVLYDEGLIDNAAATANTCSTGSSAASQVSEDHQGCARQGLDGRPRVPGLFADLADGAASGRRVLDDKLKGSLSGFVGALLLRDYNVLVAFTEYNRNVIRLEPPLICQGARRHVRRRARRACSAAASSRSSRIS